MKNFLKPTVGKILLFVVLIIGTTFIPRTTSYCVMGPMGLDSCGQTRVQGYGYPTFYGVQYSGDVGDFVLNPVNLVINIVIYYTLSCAIIALSRKMKVRKES